MRTRPGFFDYPPPEPGAAEWHVNFADPRLFCAYAGPLLAQDELQAAEHPALGALREALLPLGQALTEDDQGPTPVLVRGVERRCAIVGLYGNAFACASERALAAAVRPISPPTVSNLLAIAAPVGHGRYTLRQIERIALTAFTGFAAARAESERTSPGARTILHTGFWGCGAFGGDRVLMTALQILAARLAQVELRFHLGASSGVRPFEEGAGVASRLPAGKTAQALRDVEAEGFVWGVSNGT